MLQRQGFPPFLYACGAKNAANQAPWLIVMNSLVLEQPHQSPEVQLDTEELRQENGLITMCCHCRRTKMPKARRDLWLWIPQLVRNMPLEVSHGLCSVCFYVYYEK